jgi:polyhydroxyalkanoate synthesis regulator phasin
LRKCAIKKSILFSVPIILMLGTTTMATEIKASPSKNHTCEVKNPEKKFNKENKGFHYTRSATLILINKYGIRMDEVTKAKEGGKTVFDLAKSKGVTEQQLKDLILAPRLKIIDEMVMTGELTKEDAENVKGRMKQNINNWNGKLDNFDANKKCKPKMKEKDTITSID